MMMMFRLGYTALYIATLVAGANAFVAPTPLLPPIAAAGITARIRTERYSDETTGYDNFEKIVPKLDPIKGISYGEDSRRFRRTVYSHDEWKKHRSPDRFAYYLAGTFKSGVYRNLQREVTATVLIAFFVLLYNMVFGGYTDFAGVTHGALITSNILPAKLGLPLGAFTLASPSLGLLLVFRTNTSYKRWDEARKNWGMNINRTRDLNRMANTYYDSTGVSPEQRQEDLSYVALCTWAFVRSMKRHLSPEEEDEMAFREELYEKLPPEQAQKIIDAAHRPNRALQDLSNAVDSLPMHFMRKNEIHTALTNFEDNLGSSERLLTSPVPVFYTRHTARFVSIWLLSLPLALYDPFAATWNHIGMIPATYALSLFLFGIEELATQLEEPFTILPMQAFCDKIYNWCREIASFAPGDNGKPVKPIKPEHAYFAVIDAPPQGVTSTDYIYEYSGPLPPPQVESSSAAPNGAVEKEYQQPPPPPPQPQPSPQQLSFAEFLKSQGK